MSFARDNGMPFLTTMTLSLKERDDYKYTIEELQFLEKKYNEFKTNQKVNQRAKVILDFQDMIDYFCHNEAESERLCKKIKVLIVDEAQDLV